MPDIKTALFQAASEAFNDGEVSVKVLTPDSPKLARRGFVDNQVSIRVQFTGNAVKLVQEQYMGEDGKPHMRLSERNERVPYAVAGFIPENAKPEEVGKLITRLKLDRRTAEAALKPGPV